MSKLATGEICLTRQKGRGGGVEIEFKFEPFAVNHLAIPFLYIPGCTPYYSLKQMFFNN